MKKSNGAQWWNEDKSFYMILMLCLMAIAVAAYVLFALPTSSEEQDPMDGYLYEADDSVTASEALDRVPALDTEPAEQAEETAEQTEEPAETTTESEPEIQTAAEPTFTPPMTSDILRAYSSDTLEYDETTGDWRTHEAVDYTGKKGDAVCAIADGTVVTVGDDAIYGKYVVLSHAQDMTSVYAGLDDISVDEGDTVSGGKQIATLGDPMPLEQKQGVHLHLAVSKGEDAVDPTGLF